jgi:hypothetical protein
MSCGFNVVWIQCRVKRFVIQLWTAYSLALSGIGDLALSGIGDLALSGIGRDLFTGLRRMQV